MTLSEMQENVCLRLDDIIRLQSECIDELFMLLSQYLTMQEIEDLSVLKKITDIAEMQDALNE